MNTEKSVEEHAWPRVSPSQLNTWTPLNQNYSLHSYLLDYLVLFHKKVMLCHWEYSNIFKFVVSPDHT